jgi:hypothetical protein
MNLIFIRVIFLRALDFSFSLCLFVIIINWASRPFDVRQTGFLIVCDRLLLNIIILTFCNLWFYKIEKLSWTVRFNSKLDLPNKVLIFSIECNRIKKLLRFLRNVTCCHGWTLIFVLVQFIWILTTIRKC